MLYKELMDIFLAQDTYNNKVSLDSPETLKVIIGLKKFNLCQIFSSEAFTIENIKLMISSCTTEEEITTLKRIYVRNFEDQKEILKMLLERSFFQTAIMLNSYIIENSELLKIYLKYIANYNLSIDNLKAITNSAKGETYTIIEALVNNKRFDLIAQLLSTYNCGNIDFSIIGPLIKDDIKEIITIMNFYQISMTPISFKENFEFFDLFFLNGYCSCIDAIKYRGYENLVAHILNSPQLINKVIDYVAYESPKYFDFIKIYLPTMLTDSRYLKALIDKKAYGQLSSCKKEAWTLENQLYFLAKTEKENVNVSSLLAVAPLLNYYYQYNYNSQYYTPKAYTNLYDINNISDLNICVSILENITSSKIENNTPLTKLYEFLGNCKSKNICLLTFSLLDGDINNVSKLITMNGITKYYQDFLMFDNDYIKLLGDKVTEISSNPNYITYTTMLKLNQVMPKALGSLKINQFNLDKYINNNSLTRKAIDLMFNTTGAVALAVLINSNYELELTDLERQIIIKFNSINSEKQREVFLSFCLDNKDKIESSQIDSIYDLIVKVNNSNSYELRKQADKIITRLVKYPNYQEVFEQLENILTEGRTPEFLKRFAIYKILFGDKDLVADTGVTSPILKSSSREEADKIILNDLLRISLATGSNDIKHYLNIIKQGLKFYNSINSQDYFNGLIKLSEQEQVLLHEYRQRLEFILDYVLKLEYKKDNDDYKTLYSMEKAIHKFLGFEFNFDFHVPLLHDFILNKLSLGFSSFMALEMYMFKYEILKISFEEARAMRKKELEIKKGDFIKGINSEYLDNIINFGSLSIEFLGENSDEDVTHLDTDMSLIPEDVTSIPNLLGMNLTGCTWGDMKLIISREYMDKFNEYIVTADSTGTLPFTDKDKNKIEIFSFRKDKSHYCMRTGFPITFVKAIIASKNFDRARFIVSKSHFYIPVYDCQGNEIYSYDDYIRDHQKLEGLSFYDSPKYTISPNLVTPEIDSILPGLQDDRNETNQKRQAIYNHLNELLSKYFTEVKHQITSSVKKGTIEIIDTGSTGRNTNVAGDSDFDFIVRVDESFLNSPEFNKFSAEIYRLFGVSPGDSKRIRLDNVYLEDILEPLKIELTFISKNSKIDYTTDMCIQDRLYNISKQYPNEYQLVKANIIYAKKFFKAIGAYKTYDGGFGGVGVENWILQNGGSFYDAVTDFMKTAEKYPNVSDFKKKYHIYDYGKNHFAFAENNYKRVSFPYDDYVFSMTNVSYKKIIEAFSQYLKAQRDIETKPTLT